MSLIETCLLRHWPGNVRELVAEARGAAQAASATGRTLVEAIDLVPSAGAGFSRGGEESAAQHALDHRDAPLRERDSTPPVLARKATLPDREAIERALDAEGGNVTRAAKRLGLHRNQLRRWLEKNQVDPKTLTMGDEDE
jgi:DNA-binding NtrC family response regulator